MATVRASCPTCGDLELTTTDLRLEICSDTGGSTYSFLCPNCRLIVNKQAGPQIKELLASAGVQIVRWDLPAELAEPKQGPPITYDDLLEFHFELAQESWLQHMITRN